ncbi:hypothetical protein BH23CHL8_BH23CHL8_24660 [soil metagenome]
MDLLSRLPVHPLLLSAYAVLGVYAANASEVLPRDLLGPLAVALGGAALALVVAGLLYRDARRGAVLSVALVVAAGYFGHVSGWLSGWLGGAGVGEPVTVGLAAGLVILMGMYAAMARASLARVTAALNGFGIVLVALALMVIVPFEAQRAVRAAALERPPDDSAITATRHPDRDIYFLVFDRYGSDWSIRERFGIENDLLPDLEAAGFQVVPGARANYRATDFSLASMLSLRLLDDLTASVGPASADRTPARARLQEHEVGRYLRENGYRYYHLSAWYEATFDNPIADEVLRYGRTTEFEAVMREVSILPAVDRLLGAAPEDTDFRDRHRNEALFQFRQLRRLADMPGRKFVFAHILLPHPPYGFGADGRIVLKAEEESRPEGELFEEQLRFLNDRIRETVAALLAGPDQEHPIIVLTADEGPFLCFNTDCIDGSPETYGIRFGTLRAYYLPDLDYEVPADDTGVNIFRMLFREYFGADLPDLPNRSYDWPDNDHLYDFRDITDQLPLPGGESG